MDSKKIQWWSGGGGASYSSEFQAILTNAASRGYTETAYKSQTDAFISGMVSDGDWAEADIGYILATDQADFSRINIKSPADFLATVGGTGAVLLYEDGVQIGSTNLTSSALENLTLTILALNNSGTRLGFTNAKIGFVLVGSKLISPTNLTSRWNTYQAAIA